MQATKKPGLTKREHGESKRSGFRPTGKQPPATQYPAYLDERRQSCPPMGGAKATGQRTERSPRDRLAERTDPKEEVNYLVYLTSVRDTAESGKGRAGNRHLNSRAESVLGNVRDPLANAKASSRPMVSAGVGAVIVVGGRESRPQGEGRQSVGKPELR
jgi:hypothetical protein